MKNLDTTALAIIEKEIEKNVLDLRNEEILCFSYFDDLGIPLDKTSIHILSSEIKRFKGKLINTLMKHIVRGSAHKNTDEGKEILLERFSYD